MKVTPLDIRRKEFKRSMRGYSDEEVDVFLDEVADEFERLFQENMEMHDRVQRLEEQIAGYVQIKDALEKTLISAQLQSDEMRANARKEGELILRDAELKARHIVNDSYGETQRVQQALIQLKHLEEDFRFKFRSLLEGHLKLLSDAALVVPAPGSTVSQSADSPAGAIPVVAPVPSPVEAGPDEAEPAVSELAGSPAAEEQAPQEPVAQTPVTEQPVAEESLPEGGTTEPAAVGEAAPGPDDDVPTEETDVVASEIGSGLAVPAGEASTAAGAGVAEPAAEPAAEATAETAAEPAEGSREAIGEESPVRGFFFGRRLDEADDAFLDAETGKKVEGRDFEW